MYIFMLGIIFLEHTGFFFFNGNYICIHETVLKIFDRKLIE